MPEIDHAVFTDHSELLARTADEMQRQLKLWGEQRHPTLSYDVERAQYIAAAQQAKEANDTAAIDGEQAWDSILLEEVFEAFAEGDPAKLVEELVQCAAVALSAARSVQRYGLDGKRP